MERARFRGAGGGFFEVDFFEVRLVLLDQEDLLIRIPIGFAEGVDRSVGNLIGLDVLEHFDFALSHAERLGYLGRHP